MPMLVNSRLSLVLAAGCCGWAEKYTNMQYQYKDDRVMENMVHDAIRHQVDQVRKLLKSHIKDSPDLCYPQIQVWIEGYKVWVSLGDDYVEIKRFKISGETNKEREEVLLKELYE